MGIHDSPSNGGDSAGVNDRSQCGDRALINPELPIAGSATSEAGMTECDQIKRETLANAAACVASDIIDASTTGKANHTVTSSRRRRTETLNVSFKNGLADGFMFGVPDVFRMNFDIRLDQRVDIEASKQKERRSGRKLMHGEKVMRTVWTQGNPPAYSFDRGHMFYEPPGAHQVGWGGALPNLRRCVSVLRAKPDAGALQRSLDLNESVEIVSTISESESGSANAKGWVDFELLVYKDGVVTERMKHSMSQALFVEFLRTGELP